MASCFDQEPGRSTLKLQGALSTNITNTTATTTVAAVLLVKESFERGGFSRSNKDLEIVEKKGDQTIETMRKKKTSRRGN